MRTLTVIWLHEPSTSDFNVRMPLDYPPLKLATVSSPEGACARCAAARRGGRLLNPSSPLCAFR